MSECTRLADQIHRTFEGEAWHGDSLLEILNGVTAAQAAAHPIPNAHSIWGLVLHIAGWDGAVLKRMNGTPIMLSDEENFPTIKDSSEAAWKNAIAHAKNVHDQLVRAVAAFPDSRLSENVPGKEKQQYYDFFYMFAGIAQHECYHAGQIALLKKLL